MTCYNCNEPDHAANRCPKSKSVVCYKCQKAGHIARDCKFSAKPIHRENNNVAIGVSRADKVLHIGSEEKYFKDAYINGQYVRCYVDLGSSCVALRQDVPDELKITYLEGSFDQLTGYGNGTVTPVGMLTASLTLHEVTARVKIHVVPQESQAIPLIVDHPYTEQDHMEIVSRPNELLIRPVEEADTEQQQKTMFWVKEATVISNNYVGYIAAHTEISDKDICIEGGLREDGKLIPRCLVKTDEEGTSIVLILNISGGDVTIKEGTVLTRGESVTTDVGVVRREVNKEAVTVEAINTDLSGEDAELVKNVLNDFKDLIAKNVYQIGCTNRMEMTITLIDASPISPTVLTRDITQSTHADFDAL
ncbi:uncharacterized protein LOC143306127 [Osmia lignaria lignaria]|uniref:uncharacterized protein LOC143306127 n=1 Tax=Osmia lignaria lignaria TaxID=1437193 RepID=UPI00402BD97E